MAVSVASNGNPTAIGKLHGTPLQALRHTMASPTTCYGSLMFYKQENNLSVRVGSGARVGLGRHLVRLVMVVHLVSAIKSVRGQMSG